MAAVNAAYAAQSLTELQARRERIKATLALVAGR